MSPRMPQISARELIAFLKKQGFVEDRQSGSHRTLRHAGFTVEDYLRLR